MSELKYDAVRHKYHPLPEDGPKHKKKAKKTHTRADHKHEYEEVCVDAHAHIYRRSEGRIHVYFLGTRCKVCGRLYNLKLGSRITEPPDGMRLFDVDGTFALLDMKVLPDEMEVRR